MKLNIGRLFLSQAGGDGGGGSANPAGTGTDQGAAGGTGTGATPSNTPTPVTLKDDDLVSYDGLSAPVPFKTLRGFQSQYTKVSQAAAKHQALIKELEGRVAEREAEIKRFRDVASGGNPNPVNPALDKLRSLDYLSGEEAVGVVTQFQQALGARDAVLKALVQQIKQMDERYGTLATEHADTSFGRKMESFRKAADLPEEAVPTMRALYLSYEESPDLDEQFPEIARKHWEELDKSFNKIKQQRLKAAREKRFESLPRRGGDGKVAKPLDFAGKSADEQAEMLWPLLEGSDE